MRLVHAYKGQYINDELNRLVIQHQFPLYIIIIVTQSYVHHTTAHLDVKSNEQYTVLKRQISWGLEFL